MTAQLLPLQAGSAPAIAILRPVILVGRHLECDLRIDLPQISRRHCCLAMAYDRLVIRDLGSRNGVRVNGRLVDEVHLRPDDEVAIAHLLYRLEWSRAESPRVAKSGPTRTPPPIPRVAEVDPPLDLDPDDDFISLSD